MTAEASEIVLRVEDLVTTFVTGAGKIRPVDGVSFTLRRGKTLALVGESGSGKSVTALSLMRLVPESNGRIEQGRIEFEGQDVLALAPNELRKFRGNRAAMIFQEPMTALNPVLTVGDQVAEAFRLHRGASRSESWTRAVAMLAKVRIPDPEARARNYPHELSGGMRQRVMIAMALACNPALLIADEPTTALDVTIQAQVLRLMQALQRELGTAVLFITHDLGIVAEIADDVAVMYAGRIVERASVYDIFERPLHPYTRGLLHARPKLESERGRPLPTIGGMVPALHALPAGCRFADRCPLVEPACRASMPELMQLGTASKPHEVACFVAARDVALTMRPPSNPAGEPAGKGKA